MVDTLAHKSTSLFIGAASGIRRSLAIQALNYLGCAGWAYVEDEHVRIDIFSGMLQKTIKRGFMPLKPQ